MSSRIPFHFEWLVKAGVQNWTHVWIPAGHMEVTSANGYRPTREMYAWLNEHVSPVQSTRVGEGGWFYDYDMEGEMVFSFGDPNKAMQFKLIFA